MSSYLSHLVARSTHVASGVRPRMRALFEPLGPQDAALAASARALTSRETEEEPPSPPRAPAAAAPELSREEPNQEDRSSTHTASTQSHHDPRTTALVSRSTAATNNAYPAVAKPPSSADGSESTRGNFQPSRPAPVDVPRPVTSPRFRSVEPTAVDSVVSRTPRTPREKTASTVFSGQEVKPATPRPNTRGDDFTPAQLRPRSRQSPATPAPVSAASTTPRPPSDSASITRPEIHISIGRIVVQTAAGHAPSPRATRQPRTVSLADYLDRKNGRRA